MNRKEEIRNVISKSKITYATRYSVSPLKSNIKIKEDKNMNKVIELLDKYSIAYMIAQERDTTTFTRPYNLKREQLTTDFIETVSDTEGVYPLRWNIKDILKLDKLEKTGKVILNVIHCSRWNDRPRLMFRKDDKE